MDPDYLVIREDEAEDTRASGIMDRTGARSVDDFSSWRRHEG